MMITYANSTYKNNYDVFSRNCGNLTENTLLFGGITSVPGASQGLFGIPIIPNREYIDLGNAGGWTPLQPQ